MTRGADAPDSAAARAAPVGAGAHDRRTRAQERERKSQTHRVLSADTLASRTGPLGSSPVAAESSSARAATVLACPISSEM